MARCCNRTAAAVCLLACFFAPNAAEKNCDGASLVTSSHLGVVKQVRMLPQTSSEVGGAGAGAGLKEQGFAQNNAIDR